MKWSDEELSDVMSRGSSAAPTGIRVPALPASTLKAMMTRAVELAAARGGTMTEERVREYIKEGSDLGEHLATLGARIAVLEADVAKARQSADVWRKRLEAAAVALGAHGAGQVGRLDIVARVRILLDNTAQSRQREECIRRRSLEAGNLERLISEHGLPTAMRWVVDGAEPYAAHSCDETCTHSDIDDAEMRRRDKDGWPPFPCSPTCTHDDAATPGRPERVKERSEAFEAMHPNGSCTCAGEGICTWCDEAVRAADKTDAFERGAEAMRAACLLEVHKRLSVNGMSNRDSLWNDLTAAIEGATP